MVLIPCSSGGQIGLLSLVQGGGQMWSLTAVHAENVAKGGKCDFPKVKGHLTYFY